MQHTSGNGIPCAPSLVEREMCPFLSCPQDCVLDWSEWSDCNDLCGTPVTRSRSQVELVPASQGGQACPEPQTETQSCNLPVCTVDCQAGWSEWSECSAPCSGGERHRTMVVLVPASGGGAACFHAMGQSQSEKCNTAPCNPDCIWNWSPWSECTRSCGGGTKTRTQYLGEPPVYGVVCPPPLPPQTSTCSTRSCPNTCENRCGQDMDDWFQCSCAPDCATEGTCCGDINLQGCHVFAASSPPTPRPTPVFSTTGSCSNRCGTVAVDIFAVHVE